MQALLASLNAVPGVVGTLVCSADGHVLANGFPPVFEDALLADIAKTVAESTAGLATITGSVRMLDLRYAKARLVIRPAAGAALLFMCAPSMNLQPLEISASVAAPRLEKLVAGRAAEGPESADAFTPEGAQGKLFALLQRINAIIEKKGLDPFATRGEIALKAGFGLGFIDRETPDDPDKLAKLKAAARAVLGDA